MRSILRWKTLLGDGDKLERLAVENGNRSGGRELWAAGGHTPAEAVLVAPLNANRFYSPFVSSAQRLPNGNTLIAEGSDGRVFEVTRDHDVVWEFVNPYRDARGMNMIYRAYRVPYAWVPQVDAPEHRAVELVDVRSWRVPGAAPAGPLSVVDVVSIHSRPIRRLTEAADG